MLSASDLYPDVVVFLCVPVFCIWFGDLLDDFAERLQRTLAQAHWMIRRKNAQLVRFCVHPICKSALAARPTGRWRQRVLFRPRFVRYGPSARAVAGRVVVPHRVTSSTSQLKPTQRRALLALESDPGSSLTRSEYERLTGAGRSQAAYDLADLVSAGLFVRVGRGRSTRYVLAHEPASQRRWTPDRIRHELEQFCANRSVWPSAAEFKSAGRGDLYVAASRYGGIPHWASELGLDRIDRSRIEPTRTRVPLRSRVAWGFAGALVSAAVAAGAIAIVATHQFGSGGEHGAKAAARTQPSLLILPNLLRRPHTPSRPAAARHVPQARTHVTTPTIKSDSGARSRPAQNTSLASEPLQTVSHHTAPTTAETAAAVAAQSGGTSPLPAPTGASAPSPLKAP
jgi:hypothetical protein